MFKLFIDKLHTNDTQSFDCDDYETAIGIAKDAVYPTLNTANKHTKVFTVKLKTRDRDLNDFLITIEKD